MWFTSLYASCYEYIPYHGIIAMFDYIDHLKASLPYLTASTISGHHCHACLHRAFQGITAMPACIDHFH